MPLSRSLGAVPPFSLPPAARRCGSDRGCIGQGCEPLLHERLLARLALAPFLYPKPTKRGLRNALADAQGRRAIGSVVRRAKGESVGTEIADLTIRRTPASA